MIIRGGEAPTYAAGTANDGIAAKVTEIEDSPDGLPGRIGEDGEVEIDAVWSHCGLIVWWVGR